MKKVLITGGSGFLAMHLARRLYGSCSVWIASRNHKRLLESAEFSGASPLPLDCTSRSSINDAFSSIRPNIVVHAAATKYVDWSEKFPLEATDINVLGSLNILRASIDFGVSDLIGISTDKASPPIANTYGLTKSLMERAFSLEAKKHIGSTTICCVRYGNVLWSTGSFLPVWKQMVQTQNHITTTGSTMTRFFFSVEDAVDLVLTALNNSTTITGSILTLPMRTATVSEFLNAVVDKTGASYTVAPPRDGERCQEFLVGSSETPFSQALSIGQKEYYIITPNSKSHCPLGQAVSSDNSPRLTRAEIMSFLAPFEDLSNV